MNLNKINLIEIIIKLIIYYVYIKYIFNIQRVGIICFLKNGVSACRVVSCHVLVSVLLSLYAVLEQCLDSRVLN